MVTIKSGIKDPVIIENGSNKINIRKIESEKLLFLKLKLNIPINFRYFLNL